jgi:hypothetical protein
MKRNSKDSLGGKVFSCPAKGIGMRQKGVEDGG